MDSRTGERVRGGTSKFFEGLISDLVGYAEAEFRLSDDQPNGGTLREHLQVAEDQTGETIAELHPDPPPRELTYLWTIFAELHSGRGNNGFGPLPLSYSEIDAWSRLTAQPLRPWEVAAIKRIDTAYIGHAATKSKEQSKR